LAHHPIAGGKCAIAMLTPHCGWKISPPRGMVFLIFAVPEWSSGNDPAWPRQETRAVHAFNNPCSQPFAGA
jgi:hypothetical protein